MVQEDKSEIDFQDGDCGGEFGFPINTVLAIFISTGRTLGPSYILTKFVEWFVRDV